MAWRPRASRTAARQAARQVLERLDNPHASNTSRRHLLRSLEVSAYTGQVDLDELRTVAGEVFEGNGRDPGRFVGHVDAPVTAEAFAHITQANLAAIDVALRGALNEDLLRRAKQQMLLAEEGYVDQYSELAASAPNIYEPPTPEEAFGGCCSRLLTTIGFVLLYGGDPRNQPQ